MDFIDEREAARLSGLSVKTLQDYRWKGVGCRFYKTGWYVRYNRAEFLQWMNSKRSRFDNRSIFRRRAVAG